MRKFDLYEDVTILGTDGAKGCVFDSPSNTEDIIVYILQEDREKVYPYYGTYRIYPEWMLEKIKHE